MMDEMGKRSSFFEKKLYDRVVLLLSSLDFFSREFHALVPVALVLVIVRMLAVVSVPKTPQALVF